MIKKKVYVLGTRIVDFINDDGEKITGVNVHYIDLEKSDEGYLPARIFLRGDRQKEVIKGHGLYELDISMRLQGNKPQLIIDKFTHIESKDLTL